jgi:hypothetical protein
VSILNEYNTKPMTTGDIELKMVVKSINYCTTWSLIRGSILTSSMVMIKQLYPLVSYREKVRAQRDSDKLYYCINIRLVNIKSAA